jgi:hypothetical protein
MEKFCVFCGEKPEGKNTEHVIPQWLIELTGDPNRKAFFGYEEWLNTNSKERAFSFDSFKFPSCVLCNQAFSSLEELTKPIICKILSEESISATEFNILLDWFDKVRIGLWLGYQYLDKNPMQITPKYYITKRIRLYDRMLAIYKTDGIKPSLHFFGCNSPSFCFTPSCFSLCINNYIFLNMSYDFLFSRRIGFPYPFEACLIESQNTENQVRPEYHFTSGLNRVMVPLLKKRIRIRTTEIYQPMYSECINVPEFRELYENKYVMDNSIAYEKGLGKIFIQDNNSCKTYPETISNLWIPKYIYHLADLIIEMQSLVLEWQKHINSLHPSYTKLSLAWKKHIDKMNNLTNTFNEHYINSFPTKKNN